MASQIVNINKERSFKIELMEILALKNIITEIKIH